MSDRHDHTQAVLHLTGVSEVLAVLTAGSHQPLRILAEGPVGSFHEWVLKAPSMYRARAASLLVELAAADVLSCLGLPSPQVATITLPGLADAPPGHDEACDARLRAVLGQDEGRMGVCIRFVSAPEVVPASLAWTRADDALAPSAVALFAADHLLRNPDRTRPNPNCLVDGGQLLPIDHDLAFAGVGLIDDSGASRALTDEDVFRCLSEHIVRPALRRLASHPGWEDAKRAVASLAEQLPALRARWPDELDVVAGLPGTLRDEIARYLADRVGRVIDLPRGFAPP